jgi:hypothetical protein
MLETMRERKLSSKLLIIRQKDATNSSKFSKKYKNIKLNSLRYYSKNIIKGDFYGQDI